MHSSHRCKAVQHIARLAKCLEASAIRPVSPISAAAIAAQSAPVGATGAAVAGQLPLLRRRVGESPQGERCKERNFRRFSPWSSPSAPSAISLRAWVRTVAKLEDVSKKVNGDYATGFATRIPIQSWAEIMSWESVSKGSFLRQIAENCQHTAVLRVPRLGHEDRSSFPISSRRSQQLAAALSNSKPRITAIPPGSRMLHHRGRSRSARPTRMRSMVRHSARATAGHSSEDPDRDGLVASPLPIGVAVDANNGQGDDHGPRTGIGDQGHQCNDQHHQEGVKRLTRQYPQAGWRASAP